jgi:circadian clock protein KaiC
MVDGGVTEGSATLLVGPPGSGKSLLGIHFLAEGAARGEKGLFFGLGKAPPRVADPARDLAALEAKGLVVSWWHPPVDAVIDALGARLLELVAAHGASRVVIDGLSGFLDATPVPDRIARFLGALFDELRARSATTMMTADVGALTGEVREAPLDAVMRTVDNIAVVRQVVTEERLRRVIFVLKTTDSTHDATLHEISFGRHGIEVSRR